MSLIGYYLVSRKPKPWPHRIAIWLPGEDVEVLALARRPSSGQSAAWQIDDVVTVSACSAEDMARVLRQWWGRTSPATVLSWQLRIGVQFGRLPELLEAIGYDVAYAAMSRTCHVMQWQAAGSRSVRMPQKVVLMDVANIIPPPVLADIAAMYRCDMPGAVSDTSVSSWLHLFEVFLRSLHWLECTLDGSGWSTSAAGIGWQWLLRQHVIARDLQTIADARTFIELRQAIYGYPVLVAKQGQLHGSWVQLDVHNLYLWATATRPIAGAIEELDIVPRVGSVLARIKHPARVAVAKVWVRAGAYPWPYRVADQPGRPGLVRTWLAGDEMRLALESGSLHDVEQVWWCRASASLQRYGEDALRIIGDVKRTSDKAMYALIKYVLLAGLGRLGARGYRTSRDPAHDHARWWGIEVGQPQHDVGWARYWALGRCFRTEWGIPTGSSMPHAYACVTAAGRVRSQEVFSSIPMSEVAYRDVDAVICTERAYQQFRTSAYYGTGPGEASERARGHDIEIIGVRHYRVGDRTVCAGVLRQLPIPQLLTADYQRLTDPDITLHLEYPQAALAWGSASSSNPDQSTSSGSPRSA